MDSTIPSEIWRPVAGWPYEVSNCGRVRRVGGGKGTRSRKEMRPVIGGTNGGYYYVALCRNGVKRKVAIHVLVAEAFIGPRPYKFVVHHKDGNRRNNRARNLAYITQRENIGHAVRMGQQPIGERHPNAKLRDVDVAAIRACILAGKSDNAIAAFFDISAEHVGKIGREERRR